MAALVAAGALAGMVWIVAARRDGGAAHLRFAVTRPASAPFAGFGEAHVALGGRCLRVLVATTLAQREQGLRGVKALRPYDGMLFVFPGDTDSRFTMAQTPQPLDITFFAATGVPVDESRMTPCPLGTDTSCPVYASRQRYRYALERPAGAAGSSGTLGGCA